MRKKCYVRALKDEEQLLAYSIIARSRKSGEISQGRKLDITCINEIKWK